MQYYNILSSIIVLIVNLNVLIQTYNHKIIIIIQ